MRDRLRKRFQDTVLTGAHVSVGCQRDNAVTELPLDGFEISGIRILPNITLDPAVNRTAVFSPSEINKGCRYEVLIQGWMVLEQRRSSCRLIHWVKRQMRLNGLKSAVAAFLFLQVEHTILQISPCYSPFFLRLNTLSIAESRITDLSQCLHKQAPYFLYVKK